MFVRQCVCDCESSVVFQALFTQKQMHSPLVAPCRGICSTTAASLMRRAARGPYGRLSVPHCQSSISKLSAADSVPQHESWPDRTHTDKQTSDSLKQIARTDLKKIQLKKRYLAATQTRSKQLDYIAGRSVQYEYKTCFTLQAAVLQKHGVVQI